MSAINKNIRNMRNDGFSIIELIIIILIISIISVVSYPRFKSTVQSINLRVATDKLKDDLRYVYNFAVTNHDSAWFTIDVGSNSYVYGTYDDSTFSKVLLTDPATNRPALIKLDQYKNVTITSETIGGTLVFDWWGTPSTDGQIILNGTNTVVIEAGTGYIFEL